MTKIVVTGADGQLGCELRSLSSFSSEEVRWIFTDIAALDITDRRSVVAFAEREQPGVWINCAAWTDVDGAETDPAAAFRINAEGTRILAETAAAQGSSLVHISTDFVFDGTLRRPYTEGDTPRPLNVYGESKLAGENAVADSGCRGAVIRTSWLYSPYGKNFVKSIVGAARRGETLRVVDDQWGSPTSARGLAEAICSMVPLLTGLVAPAAVYNYCDSGVTSRFEFAREIVRMAGLTARVVPVPSSVFPAAAARPRYSALDTSAVTEVFGVLTVPWQERLAEVLQRIGNI